MLCNAGCITHSPLKTPDTGQHPQSFNTEVIKSVEVNYLLYIPDTYAVSQKKWPLILFLHGAGERGNNLKMVEMHGPPKQIAQENKTFPFLVVSPQCPEDEWWSSGKQIDTLSALLDHIVATYRVDEDKIYVTGLSMGGFGTWRLACEYPDRFAAIAPICGRGDPYVARALPHLPVWVFHGAKDSVVPLQASREMVDALKKVGGNVKFTVYPDAGHNSWSETYNNPALYQWFLKHTRSNNK
ncbi:MAG: prolyl oligopeptidase family serine peptidase [Candidatus Hydrogenedentes bacterium]|nr:prolyl oligopeptidase family serine peptidase [Candidatus Hydrogenedentota bacterium]